MKKRLLSILLASVLAVSACVPVMAAEEEVLEVIEEEAYQEEVIAKDYAEDDFDVVENVEAVEEVVASEQCCETDETVESVACAGFTFEITDSVKKQVEVSGFPGTIGGSSSAVIPSKVTISGSEYTVTGIGNGAFSHKTSLTTVTIPATVTKIGSSAFSGCKSLAGITIPNGVTSIGDLAFSTCGSLTGIVIPSSVSRIGSQAFYECHGLKTVKISEGVTEIGSQAFFYCEHLNSITIPSSVTKIIGSPFSYCTGLQVIDNKSLCSVMIPDNDAHYQWYLASDPYKTVIKSVTGGKAIREDYGKTEPTKEPTKEPSKNAYNVQFIGNGATSGSMNTQSINVNKKVKLSTNRFKRTGYTFKGWNTKKNGSGKSYKNKAQVKNLSKKGKTIKLYAQWKANSITIKFNKNGGKGSMKNMSMTYGKAKRLTKNSFTKKGYKFVGWSTQKNGSVVYANKAQVKNLKAKGTVTLYAVWKKK